MAEGEVALWHADEGWGVIESSSTPAGCFAHYSVIVMDGFRRLHVGHHVHFEFEETIGLQDSYRFRATRVVPIRESGDPDGPQGVSSSPSEAYSSRLIIELDENS